MAKKFRCRAGVAYVIIPGLGKVNPGRVIEGDQYARLCPHLLEEVKVEAVIETAIGAVPALVPAGFTAVPPPMVRPPRPFVAVDPTPDVRLPVAPAPVVIAPVAVAAPIVESEPVDDVADESDAEPSMAWTKAQLVEYATVLGLDVAGMTKAQILEDIRQEEEKLAKEQS